MDTTKEKENGSTLLKKTGCVIMRFIAYYLKKIAFFG